MCGIVGAVALAGPLVLPEQAAERMIGLLRHRGPDEFGAWRDETAFLGQARLSIIDLQSGQQPLCNEDGSIWIVFNGEVFNYPELTTELTGRGHIFATRSDTEAIVHAYEEWGPDCVDHFNGQFALAIWDARRRRLFLARDRFGIRPLFVTEHDGLLLFASEVKALLGWPGLRLDVDPEAVAEVFTYWVNVPPATPFTGVAQLPPGYVALLDTAESTVTPPAVPSSLAHASWPARLRPHRYWHPTFLPEAEDRRFVSADERKQIADRVRERLVDAAVIRLRADVPVGAYLSGGLDSSATAALIRRYTDHQLKTFSVGFTDPAYDETDWQLAMAAHIGTEHRTVTVASEEIGGSLPDVVWHAEMPLLRTAPAPLYALSSLVHGEHYKVVLTGEGADELFAGYNIFREAKVRWFWSRRPQDQARALLLTRLYPYLQQSPPEFLRKFYGVGLDRPDDPFFSHRPRWSNTGMMTTFLVPEALAALQAGRSQQRLAASLPAEFASWGPVSRAQYVEMTTFLAGYLLSSQGDRMLMGHSVEGRFPFLDHQLADYVGTLPATIKLQSLVEKSILKESVADLLPAGILNRPKQPYRAPDSASFTGGVGRDVADEFLAPDAVAAAGLWQRDRVQALARKWRAGGLNSARENMAFVGILSSQSLLRQFGAEGTDRAATAALASDELIWRHRPQNRS